VGRGVGCERDRESETRESDGGEKEGKKQSSHTPLGDEKPEPGAGRGILVSYVENNCVKMRKIKANKGELKKRKQKVKLVAYCRGHTHTHTHTHTLTHTHTHTHALTHTHIYINTYTHRHTHTHIPPRTYGNHSLLCALLEMPAPVSFTLN
jgi:hypothetical protein